MTMIRSKRRSVLYLLAFVTAAMFGSLTAGVDTASAQQLDVGPEVGSCSDTTAVHRAMDAKQELMTNAEPGTEWSRRWNNGYTANGALLDGWRKAFADFSETTYMNVSRFSPRLSFCVNLPAEAGLYTMTAEVRTPTSQSGSSFYVRVGNGNEILFDTGSHPAGAQVVVTSRAGNAACGTECPFVFELDQATASNPTTTVEFYAREKGAELKTVTFTKYTGDLEPLTVKDVVGNNTSVVVAKADGTPAADVFRFHRSYLSNGTPITYRAITDVRPLDGQTFVGMLVDGKRPVLDGGGIKLAFTGPGDNVTIQDLEIRNYGSDGDGAGTAPIAPKAQYRVNPDFGEDWTITGNYIHSNAKAGIRLGLGMQVLDNVVANNGDLGIGGPGRVACDATARAERPEECLVLPDATAVEHVENAFSGGGRLTGVRIEGNSVIGNGSPIATVPEDSGYDYGEGGIKLTWAEGAVVKDNHVLDNNGAGIYCDVFCRAVEISDNVLMENGGDQQALGGGILVEISKNIEVRNNKVCGTIKQFTQQDVARYYVGGVWVAESKNVSVSDNSIYLTSERGREWLVQLRDFPNTKLGVLDQFGANMITRGEARMFPNNISVHDNKITNGSPARNSAEWAAFALPILTGVDDIDLDAVVRCAAAPSQTMQVGLDSTEADPVESYQRFAFYNNTAGSADNIGEVKFFWNQPSGFDFATWQQYDWQTPGSTPVDVTNFGYCSDYTSDQFPASCPS